MYLLKDGTLGTADEKIRELIAHARVLNKDMLEARRKLAGEMERVGPLMSAARAVVSRWDGPLWKEARPTAGYINALRNALEALEDFEDNPQPQEPTQHED